MSKLTCNTISNTAGTHSFEVANIGGLGLTGEIWVDETANRQSDVEYTNDTGKPIVVNVNTGGAAREILVDGVLVASGTYTTSVIVPAGSTYEQAGGGMVGWHELK